MGQQAQGFNIGSQWHVKIMHHEKQLKLELYLYETLSQTPWCVKMTADPTRQKLNTENILASTGYT